MTDKPAPMVPPEVDLRGLEYMPLLGDRLFGSDFDLDANDTEFRFGLRLWWAAWKQVPAASLPREDSRLCKLAGLGENPAKWAKVKARALHGFIECSDGRLYHPVVAQQALIAWEKRAEHLAEREGDNERKRRERAERAQMFAALKAVGVTPPWNMKMKDLRRLVTAHVTPPGGPPVTAPVTPPVTAPVTPPVTAPVTAPVTEPVTVTVTAKTGRDGTGQEYGTEDFESAQRARAQAEADGIEPTRAGLLCRAMREQAGFAQTNPGDLRFAALVAQGITEAECVGLAAECVAKGKGWAWFLDVLPKRRAEAAAIALAPVVPESPGARRSEADAQQFLAEQRQRAELAHSPEAQEHRRAAMAKIGRLAC